MSRAPSAKQLAEQLTKRLADLGHRMVEQDVGWSVYSGPSAKHPVLDQQPLSAIQAWVEQQEAGGPALIAPVVDAESNTAGVQPERLDFQVEVEVEVDAEAICADADAALTEITDRVGLDWTGWLRVGAAVKLAHDFAIEGSNSGVANGRRYSDRMSEYLIKHNLGPPRLTENVRKAIKNIMINLPAVVAWRDDLLEDRRGDLTKPRSIWLAYQAYDKARQKHARGEPAGPARKRTIRQIEARAREISADLIRAQTTCEVQARVLTTFRDAMLAAGINPPVGEDELRQQIGDAVAHAPIPALFEDEPPEDADEEGDDAEGEVEALAEPVEVLAPEPEVVAPKASKRATKAAQATQSADDTPQPNKVGESKTVEQMFGKAGVRMLSAMLYGPQPEPASCVMAYNASTRTPMAFGRTKALAIKAARESVVEAYWQDIRDHDAELADDEWEEEGPDGQVIKVRRTPEDVSLITEKDIDEWPTITTVNACDGLKNIMERRNTDPERVLWGLVKGVAQFERMMERNDEGEFE